METSNIIKGTIFTKEDENVGIKVLCVSEDGKYVLETWGPTLNQDRVCIYWFNTTSELRSFILYNINGRKDRIDEELLNDLENETLLPVDAEKDLITKTIYI